MSVLLRHPGAVPALFSRDVEAGEPRRGAVSLWRGFASHPRRAALRGLPARDRGPGWLALPLALLFAEAPLIKAATAVLSMALPP